MADYNIYIRSDSSGSGSIDKTKPWKKADESTGGEEKTSPWVDKAKQFISAAQNPDSLVGGAISKAAAAIPWVAVALMIVKVADQIASNVIDMQAYQTGDYRNAVAYQNFKNSIHIAFSPISSSISAVRQEIKWTYENEKRTATRELLGDSIINANTRGV